ncbi:hypothetical protein PPERSA_01568 [Pseudocohnilembus persalinus]|uniref:Uncharacterized protein n=1 Tax=Pseudocohnilembus persalinus TaxID=266149 RepID=A0A0V0QHM9_PSEPJ|nr:hypothetical protein PPERSA_01568 [Pseudocohnilembus persalinus]|eukprot:KRX01698.1 hypothetical protein PPERSA_01568 [Pseudocohnilembus persalinus]
MKLNFLKLEKLQKRENAKKDIYIFKLLLMALNIKGMICQELKNYQRMYEAINLANYLNKNYLFKIKRIDDISKFTEKQYQIVQNYTILLEEEAELSFLAQYTLGVYYSQIQNKEQRELEQIQSEKQKQFIQSQIEIYKKFQYTNLQQQFYIAANQQKINLKTQYNLQEMINNNLQGNKRNSEKDTINGQLFNEFEIKDQKQGGSQKQLNYVGKSQDERDEIIYQNVKKDLQDVQNNSKKNQFEFQEDKQNLKFQKLSKLNSYATSRNGTPHNQSQKNEQSNLFYSDSDQDSDFFNHSFFASTDNEAEWKSNIHNSSTQRISNNQQQKQQKTPLVNYPKVKVKKVEPSSKFFNKPKVITNTDYFKDKDTSFSKQLKDRQERDKNNPAIQKEIKFKKIIQNLKYKDNYQYDDLDSHMQKYVINRVDDLNNFRKFNNVNEHFSEFQRKEDFDKNEFPYCRQNS